MALACGELIHDRGVGLKADGLGTNGVGARYPCNALQCKRSMTSVD